MKYPILATATGITLIGLGGAFAQNKSNASSSNTAPQAGQKSQPQQSKVRQNQSNENQRQTRGVLTNQNRLNRNRVDQAQADESNTEKADAVDKQPANINTEEARDDKSTDKTLRVDGQTGGENRYSTEVHSSR